MGSGAGLVCTDLVQAIPLVIAAAVGHVMVTGVDWHLLVPLMVGGAIGTFGGSRLAPHVPEGLIQRGLAIVLVISGITMLGFPQRYLLLVAGALLLFGPLAWNLLRRHHQDRSPAVGDAAGEAETEYVI